MIKVFRSSVIEASIETVWAMVRNFNALPQWHPAIADSQRENSQPSDKIGCVRYFHLTDGACTYSDQV